MQIHELPDVTAIGSGGYFATDNGSQTTKIDYDALAKAIIEQYSASTLAGSAQSVKTALDGLNNTNVYVNSITKLNDALNAIQAPKGILVQAYSNEVVNVLAGETLSGKNNMKTWFSRQSSTAYMYTMNVLDTEYTYTGVYNPTTSTASKIVKEPTRAEVDALNSNFGGMRMYMNNTNALSYSFTLSNKDNSRHSAGLFFGGTANGREFCYLLWINSTSNLVTITKLYDGVSARVFEATYDASTKTLTIQRTDATESGDRIFGGIRLIIG